MLMNDGRQLKCGRLFVRVCEGILKHRGGGGNSNLYSENGPSTKKFEALNPVNLSPTISKLHDLDYVHSVIQELKLTRPRLTEYQQLQINLATSLHNLFQDDTVDPLELVLAITINEPYTDLPILPIGLQPKLDANRCDPLMKAVIQYHQAMVGVLLLREVGLGQSVIDRLEAMMVQLESEIKPLIESYKRDK